MPNLRHLILAQSLRRHALQPLEIFEAACDLPFEPSDNKIPNLVLAAIKFVMTGYFSDAHQSGLYNRQLRLWETISKIAVVEVQPVTKGFFQKVTLPVYELVFKTVNGKVPIVALVIEPSATASHLELLKDFLAKVAKIQAQSGNQVKGAFVPSVIHLSPSHFELCGKGHWG